MNLPADYHMHTPLCCHAVGRPVDYAAHALKVGLREIGFSDHAPMPRDDFDDWRMKSSELDEYVEMVREAQRDFPQLSIKLGLEVDYIPGYENWIRDLAARHSWDYFIGSVHYVDEGWDIDNPKKLSHWKQHDPDEVWELYAARLTQAAASGLFESIGHMDLAKKFCIYPTKPLVPMFDTFLRTAAAKGVAIEINTAGLRKDCREIYPSQSLLKAAAAAGVKIVFGSDAHAPEEVGLNYTEALQAAKLAGFSECQQFSSRNTSSSAITFR